MRTEAGRWLPSELTATPKLRPDARHLVLPGAAPTLLAGTDAKPVSERTSRRLEAQRGGLVSDAFHVVDPEVLVHQHAGEGVATPRG